MELLFSFIYQETSSVQNFKVQPEELFTTYIYSQHSCSQSKNTVRRAVYNIHLQPAMLFTNHNNVILYHLSALGNLHHPCLPYCSHFFPIFPCFSSTGQYDGGGGCFRPISPFLPISSRFSPLLPESFPIPSRVSSCSPVVSRIANMGRNGPIRVMCNGGITN